MSKPHRIEASTVVFSSGSNTKNIQLKTANSEHLQIKALRNDKLYDVKMSGDMNLNQLIDPVSLQHSNPDGLLHWQGIGVALNDKTIVSGGPDHGSNNAGGIALFNAIDYQEGAILTAFEEFGYPVSTGNIVSINKENDRIVFSSYGDDDAESRVFIAKQNEEGWSPHATINAKFGKISGRTIVVTGVGASVKVYNEVDGEYQLASELVPEYEDEEVENPVIPDMFDIQGNVVAVRLNEEHVRIFKKTDEWRLLHDLTDLDGYVESVTVHDGRAIIGTRESILIFGDEFEKSILINDVTVTAANSKYIFALTGEEEAASVIVIDRNTYASKVVSAPYAESIACTETAVIVGKPTLSSEKGGAVLYKINNNYLSNVETIANEISLGTRDLRITARGGKIMLNGDVVITGSLNVGGSSGGGEETDPRIEPMIEELQDLRAILDDIEHTATATTEAFAPWTGTVTFKRVGKRVTVTGVLSGADPWDVDNAWAFNTPYSMRPATAVIINAYSRGGICPMQFLLNQPVSEEDLMTGFFINPIYSVRQEGETAGDTMQINTYYFMD